MVPNDVDATTGRYTVTLRHLVRNVTVRALFNDPGHLPDKAGPATVKAYAKLTTPSFRLLPPASGTDYRFGTRDTVVSGFLKPRHAAGSRAVTVQYWRYVSVVKPGESPHWELARTVRAKVNDYSSYSHYRVKVTLHATLVTTRWRVRAIHSDGDHAKTVSGFSAVRNLAT